jgi:DNA-directed RNA polymerase subunit RPC12/RpoP
MQQSLELSKLHKEDGSFKGDSIDFVCNECGGTFQKPILATVSSSGRVQTYYACPRCMARISKERKEVTISKEDIKKSSVRLANDVKCKHFLGYLKKRPKDAPIPDECLTCDKMIECLLS